MDIAAIRTALANNLSAVYGSSTQVSPYVLSQSTPPTIQVFPGRIQYQQAMGGGLNIAEFIVEVYVPSSTDIGAQKNLDPFLNPSGIPAAIEADRTLGGIVGSASVQEVNNYGEFSLADGTIVLGCRFTVQVYAS